jgi:hypothetical protein
MAANETLLKKTQRGLSILAFETTKQSRILKKRMRVAALQKEIKADLRDLGNLVYNAIINDQPGILGEEEVRILVQNIRHNKAEVERLRDSIGRLNKAKKHFSQTEDAGEEAPAEPDESPVVVVEPGDALPPADAEASTARELEAAVFDPGPSEPLKKKRKGTVPPAQGADVEGEDP